MPGGTVSRSWRRFLRFSLRELIVFVIVVGVGLGWIVRQAHVQRDAVAAIEGAGGAVRYDWEFNNGKDLPGGKPRAPRWLVNLIGVDYFGHVTAAVAHHMSARTSHAVIAQVGRLTRLQSLNLHDSSITDLGLVHLKGLTNLSVVLLYRTQVSDAGLVHLKGLTNLSYLSLDGTQVSDAGLVHVKRLTNLSSLSLERTQISDAGLVHLQGLTNLIALSLERTQVSDAGLVHLKGLTNLSVLLLECTQVTDAGVNELKRALPSLRIHH
jgi:Leucine-rich repeat (LRR) protein